MGDATLPAVPTAPATQQTPAYLKAFEEYIDKVTGGGPNSVPYLHRRVSDLAGLASDRGMTPKEARSEAKKSLAVKIHNCICYSSGEINIPATIGIIHARLEEGTRICAHKGLFLSLHEFLTNLPKSK